MQEENTYVGEQTNSLPSVVTQFSSQSTHPQTSTFDEHIKHILTTSNIWAEFLCFSLEEKLALHPLSSHSQNFFHLPSSSYHFFSYFPQIQLGLGI